VSIRLPPVNEAGQEIEAVLEVMKENSDGSAVEYVDEVISAWQRRALLDLSKWHDQQISDGIKPVDEIDDEYASRRQEIMARGSLVQPKHISEAARRVIAGSSKVYQEGGLAAGFDTGMSSLDEIMGRILNGDLVFILGAQGDGKSSLATQVGMHVAKTDPVLMFQMEMSDEQVAARELASLSGVTASQIQAGQLDMFKFDKLKAAEDRLVSSNFWILECDKQTIAQIESRAVAMKRSIGLSMLIIDQLDKVKAVGKARDRFERFAEVTGDLKSLAKRLEVPIICLVQRTRGAQRRDDPTPSINDSDAPSVERDADICVAVWRRHTWLINNRPDRNSKTYEADMTQWRADLDACVDGAGIICLKRRRGKAFEKREFTWDGAFTRFVDDRVQDGEYVNI
jgi:replicative DNA helicase